MCAGPYVPNDWQTAGARPNVRPYAPCVCTCQTIGRRLAALRARPSGRVPP